MAEDVYDEPRQQQKKSKLLSMRSDAVTSEIKTSIMSDEMEEMKQSPDKGNQLINDYDDRQYPAHKLSKKTPGQNEIPSESSNRKKKRTPGMQ